MDKKHYCYILECADKTLYTGYTDKLDDRVKKHNAGEGAKYTRGRTPCKLVYYEEFDKKEDAMKREYYIKHKLSRTEKLELIKQYNKNFSCDIMQAMSEKRRA